ncbi:MAG TPA: hypothetical protein VF170_17100, partial [Planctomycetaceae bacterium]
MRFRGRRQPPPYLSRTDRSRLFRLGLGLVLVLAAIQVAADPATWVWLFPDEADRTTVEPTLADVSYAVKLDGEDGLAPDEFRSEPDRDAASPPASGGRQFSGSDLLDPALFTGVEDDTLGLRSSERNAYFAALSRLRSLDGTAVEAAADPSAAFPAVMTEPDHYRGRPVAIDGLARRILDIPAGSNAEGFETLYELWVFTPDSGNNPWRVVATELPPGLPRGESLEGGVPVRVAGVFFKRQGYETRRHELHVAPVLLAKTVRRVRPPAGPIAEFDPTPWVLGAAAVVGLGLCLLFWRFRREDRAFERTTLSRFTAASHETVAAIPPADDADPGEFFRKLE